MEGTESIPIRPPMLLLAALFALIVLAQGIAAPFDKDAEPQSAQWIVSVVRDGAWLIPRDYYGAIDRKPPLFYWLAAAVTEASGGTVDEVRARIVSLMAGAALATIVLAWTAANCGATEGWLAFLFLLGIYGYSSRATLALTDMLMTLFAMSAYLAMFPLLNGVESPRRARWVGIILGLGVLTKGPVVIVLVGLAAAIYLLMKSENPIPILRRGWPWKILGVAIGVAAIWYIPWLASGERHVVQVFLKENLGHFLPEKYGGTGEAARPPWYIAVRTVGGSLPIVMLLPASAAAIATGEIGLNRRRAFAFQAAFAIATVAFFSMGSAKRDDYILPAMPPIAILCAGAFFLDKPREGTMRWGARLRDGASAAIGIAMLMLLVAAWIPLGGLRMQSSDAALYSLFQGMIRSAGLGSLAFIALTVSASATVLIAIWRRNQIAQGVAVGVLAIAGTLLMTASIRPALERERTPKPFLALVKARIEDAPVFLIYARNYELSYYLGRGIGLLTGRRAAHPPAGRPYYLIAYDRDVSRIPQPIRSRMKQVARAGTVGGEGPPTLYEVDPIGSPVAGLNVERGAANK
ncbi:MAG TPA: glycosyltransferase family 39 protein [Candidatus Binataceae bacterium]|nr:glycosyltransferase family 39 protein [Candidatus Binataceae bacterium]